MNLLCLLIDHDDPVMKGLRVISRDELYKQWKNIERNCKRCGKSLKP
jgi:hypothetical protein